MRGDIVAFDCMALDETLNSDFTRPLVEFNFGPRAACPKIVTRLRRIDEADARLEQIKTLVELGAKVPARVAADITGVTLLGDPDQPLMKTANWKGANE